jgi:hypothetical protein
MGKLERRFWSASTAGIDVPGAFEKADVLNDRSQTPTETRELLNLSALCRAGRIYDARVQKVKRSLREPNQPSREGSANSIFKIAASAECR